MSDLKISSSSHYAQSALPIKRQAESKVNIQNQTELMEKNITKPLSVSGAFAAAVLGINFKGNSNPALKGHQTEAIIYRDDGTTPKEIQKYIDGQLAEVQFNRPDGTCECALTYKNGKPTAITLYAADGKTIEGYERLQSSALN